MRLPVLPLWFCLSLAAAAVQAQHLPGTQLLTPPADPAAEMVAGLDRYLDRHRATLAPVRAAFRASRPAGTPQAHTKYWLACIGQVGGPVRRPLLNLTDDQKAVIRDAVAGCGLRLK